MHSQKIRNRLFCHSDQREESCFYRQLKDPSLLVGMTSRAFCKTINFVGKGTALMEKPLIAITMGDPSGVGPEIIVRALANPEIRGLCRPLVLGDPAAMERALAITGAPLRLELAGGNSL